MDNDEKTKLIRMQRRAVQRRMEECVGALRHMVLGDARAERANAAQALHECDEARRRLDELEGTAPGQLPLLPENAGQHEAPGDES